MRRTPVSLYLCCSQSNDIGGGMAIAHIPISALHPPAAIAAIHATMKVAISLLDAVFIEFVRGVDAPYAAVTRDCGQVLPYVSGNCLAECCPGQRGRLPHRS